MKSIVNNNYSETLLLYEHSYYSIKLIGGILMDQRTVVCCSNSCEFQAFLFVIEKLYSLLGKKDKGPKATTLHFC